MIHMLYYYILGRLAKKSTSSFSDQDNRSIVGAEVHKHDMVARILGFEPADGDESV
jgi:hypothetical protein